jgi:hypothetical protein
MIPRLLASLTLLGWASLQAQASTLDVSGYPLLATFKSQGQYDLSGLGTWNGEPVTPTNMPSADNRYLAATFNFYGNPTALNVMYVQVSDVITTLGANWFGLAFTDVTLTGVRVTNTDPVPVLGFSNSFANPGQVLAYGGATESTQPLQTTPGYQLDSSANSFWIHTSQQDAFDGFTSLTGIYGATRIRGGGLFQLTFAPYINVSGFSYSNWSVAAEYGDSNQFVAASLVPEPSTCLPIASILLPLFVVSRSAKSRNRVRGS